MSNLETLLTAWLNDGEVPEDFQPETRIEEYLVAILNGVDDDVTPESRADVLLDAIATKYAGYADGIADLEDELGVSAVPPTPQQLATLQAQVNEWHLQSLAEKGITPEEDNTFQILAAYEQNWPSGGAELNIAYGDTAPEDTSKLWVKTARPQNVTVDYNPDNTVETVYGLAATIGKKNFGGAGVVGNKIYLFGGVSIAGSLQSSINIFDTTTETVATSPTSLPLPCAGVGVGVVGKKCYLFGGNINGAPSNVIRCYDTETNTLTTLTAVLPQNSKGLACAAIGAKIYLFGGVKITGYTDVLLNTICVYDTESDTISTLAETLPTATWGLGVGVVGTNIYLFAGVDAGDHAVWEFDTETNTLTTLTAVLPSGNDVGVGTVGTKCYIFGVGYFQSNGEIYCFDAETNTLTTITETLPQKNISIDGGCAAVGTNIYIFGGYSVVSSAFVNSINKFTVTFPLNDGDVYLQSDVFKNKFTLVKSPTEVKTGVSAVYVGNAQNEAEYADALLYDGTAWQPIT